MGESKDDFKFNPETHTYTLNGERLAGVSSILRYAGFNDMSMIRQDVLERAQEFGNAIHLACEYLDKETLDEEKLDPNLIPYLQGWKKFKKEYQVKIIDIEKIVYSEKWKCAGCLDRVVDMKWKNNNIVALLDIKSTTTMNPAIALQSAAYKLMWNEMMWEKEEQEGDYIQQRLGVQLIPNDYKIVPYDDKTDERVFLACLQIRNWKKNRGIK